MGESPDHSDVHDSRDVARDTSGTAAATVACAIKSFEKRLSSRVGAGTMDRSWQ